MTQPVPDYLDQMAISEDDHALIQDFHNALSSITMEECKICCEKWFDINVDHEGICRRCRRENTAQNNRQNNINVYSESNNMDPGPSIQEIARTRGMKVPEPLSQVEEMMISPVYSDCIV